MHNKKFIKIRKSLSKTQKELAKLLCVSHKAIQSYEQGWRTIPSHIEKQMLLLLSLKEINNGKIKPCWETKNCPPEWRSNCIVWEYKARHFCWFLNGTYCQGKLQNGWDEKVELCKECKVYRDILSGV
jgi:DNA-binding XRE family transcriptional regulator